MNKYCNNCGSELAIDSLYCEMCGQAVPGSNRAGNANMGPSASTESTHLPPSNIVEYSGRDVLLWTLTFWPIIGSIIIRLIQITFEINWVGQVIFWFSSNTLLVSFDLKRIKAKWSDVKVFGIIGVTLTPVYIYKRSVFSNMKMYAFFISIVILILANASVLDLFSKDTYWGSGLPACNSKFEKRMALKLYNKIANDNGVSVQDAKIIKSIDNDNSVCSAVVYDDMGAPNSVSYSISKRDGKIYTKLRRQDDE